MSIVTITNSDGEKFETEVPELPEGITTSGYITPIDIETKPYDECTAAETACVSSATYPVKNFKINSVLADLYDETFNSPSEITEAITEKAEEKVQQQQQPQFHNRAERRRFAKKLGKSGRAKMGTISETAKKLTYVNLIQKLRELNEEKENENYEQATED